MDYVERTYRKGMGAERFRSFTISYLETDLWIGVDALHYSPDMHQCALDEVKRLRAEMDSYITRDTAFKTSLAPHAVQPNAPAVCVEMAEAARIANVGPMAAVAGAFARRVGERLKERFNTPEVVVENGGDIYMDVHNDMLVAVFAGESPLSEKVGIRIPKAYGALGVCTSSGTVGHSLSFGKADAVMVACRNTALADAYATSIANRIQTPADIEPVIEQLQLHNDMLSVVIICGDRMGAWGELELEPVGRKG